MYPEKAYKVVAACLRLEYDKIGKFMDRAAALQTRLSGLDKKGADVSETQADIYKKRTKFRKTLSEEVINVTNNDKVAHQLSSQSFLNLK